MKRGHVDLIDCGSLSGSLATFLCKSDCTPKHPFVDLAPAFEEPPDVLSAPSILHSTVLRGMVRPNHTYVIVRGVANAEIQCHTRTEPGPHGLLLAEANAISIRNGVASSSLVCCLLC